MEGFDDVNTETSLGQIHGAEKHFALPVDSENKATEFRLASAAVPRMRAFPLSWISFFSCFLTATDVGNAGIASVSDAVFACLVMGAACDLGPRLAAATLCLLTNPAVFAAATISYPTGFLLECFFTGFSLSTFVSTQFWMSSMFSAPVVGSANAVAAGWATSAAASPSSSFPSSTSSSARRALPASRLGASPSSPLGTIQMLSSSAVLLFGQDLPDGNYYELHNSGEKMRDKAAKIDATAATNYRAWILALTNGYCFGVELTVDNIMA